MNDPSWCRYFDVRSPGCIFRKPALPRLRFPGQAGLSPGMVHMNAGFVFEVVRNVCRWSSLGLICSWGLLQALPVTAVEPPPPIVVKSLPVVAGTGVAVKQVGDDVEDVNW